MLHNKKPQLFLDMDGVLADFDRHHHNEIGHRPNKLDDNVDWKQVRQIKDFYYNIPPMRDAMHLWNTVKHLKPVILTGIPASVREASDNKKGWVRKHLGSNVPVITCLSRKKSEYCSHGDILVDDWEKYKDLWVQKGGIWVTHTSAASSIKQLKRLGVL
jgi:hypothetical protein